MCERNFSAKILPKKRASKLVVNFSKGEKVEDLGGIAGIENPTDRDNQMVGCPTDRDNQISIPHLSIKGIDQKEELRAEMGTGKWEPETQRQGSLHLHANAAQEVLDFLLSGEEKF